MLNKFLTIFVSVILFFGNISTAQDSIKINRNNNNSIKAKSFILPGSLILYGALTLNSKGLQNLNHDIQNKVTPNDLSRKCHIDNYLQFAPGFIALGLNASGVKGAHNFKDAAIIYAMSNVILTAIVMPTKHFTSVMRPDSSAVSSFPSGHTSEAFASAEFMRMEYKNVSPWYGIAGYAMAGLTGYLRMYNNKHWFNDVIAGAGVGIASTKIAYWIYSKVEPKLSGKKDKNRSTFMMPSYQNKQLKFNLVKNF